MSTVKGDFATLITFNSTGLTTSFQELSATGAAYRILQIVNECGLGITLSFDGGTTSHWYIPAGSAQSLDLTANGITQHGNIDIKSSAASTGNIYVMGIK